MSVRSFISLLPSLFPTFSLSLSFLRVPSSLPFSLFSVLPPHLSSLILLPLSTFDCSLTCSASLCTYLQRVHTKRNPAFNKQPPIHASFYPKSLHSFSSPCCYSGKRTTPKVTCPFLMERTKRRAMHACKKETLGRSMFSYPAVTSSQKERRVQFFSPQSPPMGSPVHGSVQKPCVVRGRQRMSGRGGKTGGLLTFHPLH